MDGGRKKLMSHILLVVAPLLMLIMLTAAWFISSRTVSLSEMSFAAKGYGPGAVLYKAKTPENRVFDQNAATLAQDVTWGPQETVEHSDITIEHMVPGQCEYYLLVSEGPFTPLLTNITITDADNAPVADAAKLPLARCLGLYLIPTTVDLDKPVEGQVDMGATITLAREADHRLTAAVFTAGTEAVLPAPVPPGKQAYILAVYCDPVYGQNTPGHSDHVGTLEGKISFSLSFAKEA